MRARLLAAAALAVLGGACANMRSMTQADREQASRQAMEKPHGTILTAGELSKLDLDRTFICEVQAQVGSHIPRYQCRSLRRVERESAVAMDFVGDGSSGFGGTVPQESSSPGTTATDLTATKGGKVIKNDRPQEAADKPALDQDPRFPPL